MAGLRTIRTRIKSVASTQKITKAMKMVAAARLRRSQQAVEQSKPYNLKVEEFLSSLAPSVPPTVHPYLQSREVKKRLLVVFSSDRGLCGSFNANLLRRADRETKADIMTECVVVGRKGNAFALRRQWKVYKRWETFWQEFSYETSEKCMLELSNLFLGQEFDQVDLMYNEFLSVISQKPKLTTLFPLTVQSKSDEAKVDYIYEPSLEEIVKALIPKVANVRFYSAALHSMASEYGARMTAMDSATRNAGEMIDNLTLTMNRVRQAAITKELMEIISGAEALK